MSCVPSVCIFSVCGQMTEGVPIFHPRPPEEVAKMMCLDGKRPVFKTKSRGYPPDMKE